MKTAKLVAREPFSTLFPIKPETYIAIEKSMRAAGFDAGKPIAIWGDVVVDGHTRLRAALEVGIGDVAVHAYPFKSELEALAWAIASQRDRRNLEPEDIIRCVEAVDKRLTHGAEPGGRGNQYASGKSSREPLPTEESAAQTAKLVGVSPSQVKRVRAILDHGGLELREQVERKEKTIAQAAAEVRAVKRHERAIAPPVKSNGKSLDLLDSTPALAPFYTLEQWSAMPASKRGEVMRAAATMRSTSTFVRGEEGGKIEWALWSWNPVTGCLHNCDYCYARDIANRFYEQKFAPSFVPHMLTVPRRMKITSAIKDNIGEKNVFTCSMADLFGKWVPEEWIKAVLAEVYTAPSWNFLFLTKFPQRLATIEWPDNAWVGTTVDRQSRVAVAEKAFRGVKAGIKWLSCEPLLEPLEFSSLKMFDWVVIGSSSKSARTEAFQPPWAWVESLIWQAREAGCKVYLKPNLESRPREYPGGVLE